jgi:hypothetical protein
MPEKIPLERLLRGKDCDMEKELTEKGDQVERCSIETKIEMGLFDVSLLIFNRHLGGSVFLY